MEIIGHQKQWEFLKKAANTGKISHAYLFTGQEKLGKKTMALEWISLLFGQTPNQDFGGVQHPDLLCIQPEDKEIQIGQIRELIWKLSLKPYSAPFKAVIIDQAHSMNQEAQTSILKTLEEPKGKTFLILITEYPEHLFSTIRSRVETLKFYPVKKEEIKNYLKKQGISEKDSEEISKISMGKPGIALDFISNPQKINLFQEKVKELNKVLNSEMAFRFQYAKDLSQEENLSEVLNIWLNYFRNILLSHLNLQKKWVSLTKEYSLEKLKNILNLIQNTKFLISTTNINTRLALEILMLEL